MPSFSDDPWTSDQHLEELQAGAFLELESCATDEALDRWRIAYLGRNGKLTQVLRGVGLLPPDQRRLVGAASNKVKTVLEERLKQHRISLLSRAQESYEEKERIDVTLPGRPLEMGSYHPSTRIVREICDAFVSMGFHIVEGPEVEWDRYNFELLNIPRDHPARDMWDTLWIDYADDDGHRPLLLRTHTSPMQARVMESQEPPVRVIVPGKCYRYEATDATHESQFYQIEGLAVDEGINFAHLKGTLYEFARRIFGQDRRIRFRCDYFPFVEPGVDMSIDCFNCQGSGHLKGGSECRICKETGWIEIMGAGMVHPKVLAGVGYDPEKYTGFAFGLGPERIAMLKYGIDDIRLFYGNDIRFLRQF